MNMAFKFVIGHKGKAWKVEKDADFIIGKTIGDKIEGKELGNDLDEYEFEITGGSDIAGFPLSKDVEGIGLKRVLLIRGWGMHDKRKGVRLRKTVRGKVISDKSVQINMKVVKEGKKKLEEIFNEQNKPEEVKGVKNKPEFVEVKEG